MNAPPTRRIRFARRMNFPYRHEKKSGSKPCVTVLDAERNPIARPGAITTHVTLACLAGNPIHVHYVLEPIPIASGGTRAVAALFLLVRKNTRWLEGSRTKAQFTGWHYRIAISSRNRRAANSSAVGRTAGSRFSPLASSRANSTGNSDFNSGSNRLPCPSGQ